MTINLNDTVTVRLTETGRRLVIASGQVGEAFVAPVGEPFRVQLWVLMAAVGGSLHIGMGVVPFAGNCIEVTP
jgi:hypothetical protein